MPRSHHKGRAARTHPHPEDLRQLSFVEGRTLITGRGWGHALKLSHHGYHMIRLPRSVRAPDTIGRRSTELYRADHCMWAYFTGYWPQYIEHLNGVLSDDSIENLVELRIEPPQEGVPDEGIEVRFWFDQNLGEPVRVKSRYIIDGDGARTAPEIDTVEIDTPAGKRLAIVPVLEDELDE